MRIDSISKEQASRFSEWAQKWIATGLSVSPADFDRATEAALRAYKLCNLDRPKIVLRMSSPYGATVGGAMALMMLREIPAIKSQVESQVRSEVWSQVRSEVWSQVRSEVWSQVESQVGSEVWSQVRSQVWSQVRSQVWSQVRSQVESQVESQVGSEVWSQVRSQVWSQVWSQVRSQVWSQVGSGFENFRGGAFWASWCAYVSYIRDVLKWEDPVLERFKIDEDLAQSCGWVWWHENVLAISDRPSILNRDDQGRMHCENGPSIHYRDGWNMFHWHGVQVPEYVIVRPSEITVKDIESESNAEVRRVKITRFGQARYLIESGAAEIHRDDFGVLYSKLIPNDEPLVMVKVVNSTAEPDGSFKDYFLRVQPELRPLLGRNRDGSSRFGEPQKMTAHNAVASTFGLRGEEYAPCMET